MTEKTGATPGTARARPGAGRKGQGRRSQQSLFSGCLLASVVAHALVFWLQPGSAARERGAVAAARAFPEVARGGMQGVTVRRSPAPQPIPRPARPVIVAVPDLTPREVDFPHLETAFQAGPVGLPLGAGGAGDAGRGAGDADGSDDYVPAIPRSVAPRWNPPESARGMEITVRVFVAASGEAGLVELDPPTPDERFNREIIRAAREWRYQPATRLGSPVDGWAEIVFVF